MSGQKSLFDTAAYEVDAARPPSNTGTTWERARKRQTGYAEVYARRRGRMFEVGEMKHIAFPFLRWAGGKRRWLAQLYQHMPDQFERYWEPFLGGGAVFWMLAAIGRLQPHGAFLPDLHPALIALWRAVRDEPEELIRRVHDHIASDTKELYLREARRRPEGGVELGAWLWWMAQGAFQGICKFNDHGHCVGSYGDGLYPDPAPNFEGCHYELQRLRAVILSAPYDHIDARPGDFVYFDPPYYAAHGYTNGHFPDAAHTALRDFAQRLADRGVKVALSNSNNEYVRALYGGFYQHEIEVMYTMADSPFERITELLVTSYETPAPPRPVPPEVQQLRLRTPNI